MSDEVRKDKPKIEKEDVMKVLDDVDEVYRTALLDLDKASVEVLQIIERSFNDAICDYKVKREKVLSSLGLSAKD